MSPLEINLSNEQWLKAPELVKLMGILNKDADNARIVGGAVRDSLLNLYGNYNKNIVDIDIATKTLPSENIALLETAQIKVIPTGIKHGTITAVLAGKPYEITTLRRDVLNDGRWADVEYTVDWLKDATRRDFTINALYLKLDGTIYDPLDGISDILTPCVRFIGDGNKRIKEDALRILRFFRFTSQINDAQIDQKGLKACGDLKHMIKKLSGERIWQELHKILSSQGVAEVLRVMAGENILNEILPDHQPLDQLMNYIDLERQHKRVDIIGRLSCLLTRDEMAVKTMATALKLSNIQTKLLLKYAKIHDVFSIEKIDLRKSLYNYGRNVVIHNLCRDANLSIETLKYIENYQIPVFPIGGRDLEAKGWQRGREIGIELNKLEQIWIDSDFKTLEI